MGFEILDATFNETLLLTSRMILSVLAQIAVATRFGDGLNYARTVFSLQTLQFGSQTLRALQRQWQALHDATS
jgi:hypothetical protein